MAPVKTISETPRLPVRWQERRWKMRLPKGKKRPNRMLKHKLNTFRSHAQFREKYSNLSLFLRLGKWLIKLKVDKKSPLLDIKIITKQILCQNVKNPIIPQLTGRNEAGEVRRIPWSCTISVGLSRRFINGVKTNPFLSPFREQDFGSFFFEPENWC